MNARREPHLHTPAVPASAPGNAAHQPTAPEAMTLARYLFGRGSWTEATRIAAVLRRETVGGALLLAAALVAVVWANSPWGSAYFELRDAVVGPPSLHLDLPLSAWAADGLLAVFFFVAGLEVKREFVAGNLRDPRRAVLPVPPPSVVCWCRPPCTW
jgi:NhaA family Na+:H+ antiporter